MKSKKHIDDLFKEGISGFSAVPSERVWQNIEGAYFSGMKNGRKWFIYSTAAIILLLAGLSGWYFITDSDIPATGFTEADHTENTSVIPKESESEQRLQLPVETQETEIIPEDRENKSEVFATDREQMDVAESKQESITYTALVQSEEEDFHISEKNSDAKQESIYTDIAPISGLNISFENYSKPEMIDPEKITGMQAYLEKQKKSHFYTGLSATPAMVYYPSTKDQFTWSADLSLGITFNRFYLETGIGYQEMKEEGIYTIEFRSKDSIGFYNEVQSFEVNPDSPNEITYNTEKVTVYDSINHYTHSTPTFRYNYVNIPLNFGYKVYDKKKFSVSVETGFIVSWMTGKEIPEPAFNNPEYTVIQAINETPERVDMNFRWQAAVRLDYKIAGAMSVSVKPVFSKYLNSIYDTDKGFPDVKPYSMGMQIGLFYGF